MGDLVCIDSSTGQAVPYDSESSNQVIGVAFIPSEGYNPNGRNWFAINGPVYYENDFYEWKDDLTSDFTLENTSYNPFNPLNTEGYVSVITNGIAPIKSSISAGIPSDWILLKNKSSFKWYIVR